MWKYLILYIGTIILYYNLYKKFFYIKTPERKRKTNKEKIIVSILIPVFKEEKIIESTVSHFKKLKKKNINIYYITTNKEKREQDGVNPTEKIIKSSLKGNGNIIQYPYSTWDKGHQLNYAIKKILLQNNKKEHYFVIFDADSKPKLSELNNLFENTLGDNLVYQMISIYNTNFKEVPNICKANAILQTRWSFYFEYKRLINNYIGKQRMPMYLIGHGLILNSKIVESTLFPENSITEDINYGYKLYLWNIYAKPLTYFDYCSVPSSLKDNTTQISRRFYGEIKTVLKYISTGREKTKFILRFWELLLWGYWGLLTICLISLTIYYNMQWLFITLNLGIMLDYISFRRISKHFFINNELEIFYLYIRSLAKNILDSIPISISIFESIFKKGKAFEKTER